MDYRNKIVDYVRRDTPDEIKEELNKYALTNGKLLEVIDISKVGSYWFAWYRSELETPRPPTEKPKRKPKGK